MKKFTMIMLSLAFPMCALADSKITLIDVFVELPLITPSIPHAKITVFDLSQVAAVKATAPRFPAEVETATVMATHWLESEEGHNYINRLKAAYAGRTKMIEYGVLKLPAIVFDGGKYVVYGTSDVQQAVKDYDQFVGETSGELDAK